jgi:hypothetical protein
MGATAHQRCSATCVAVLLPTHDAKAPSDLKHLNRPPLLLFYPPGADAEAECGWMPQRDDVSQGVAASGSAKGDVGVKLRARLRVEGEHDTDPSLSPRSKLAKAACSFASKPAIYCRPKVRARRIGTAISTAYMLSFHAYNAVHYRACF